MTDVQWSIVKDFIQCALELLKKIEKNTRTEDVEETSNPITGFKAGGSK